MKSVKIQWPSMSFASKMTDSALQMVDFVFKMMNSVNPGGHPQEETGRGHGSRGVSESSRSRSISFSVEVYSTASHFPRCSLYVPLFTTLSPHLTPFPLFLTPFVLYLTPAFAQFTR